jgi:hypothetical protein
MTETGYEIRVRGVLDDKWASRGSCEYNCNVSVFLPTKFYPPPAADEKAG